MDREHNLMWQLRISVLMILSMLNHTLIRQPIPVSSGE